MADFFKKEESKKEEDSTEQEEVKIKVGEEEYKQEDLDNLVAKGKYALEMEEKYNTKFEKAWPEYGRRSNEVKELKDQLKAKEEEEKETKLRGKQVENNLTADEQRELALAEANKLGIVTSKNFSNFMSNFMAGYELNQKAQKLENEIDGKDGRPQYKAVEILEHMEATGIKDPMKAYKDKYEEQLDSWKAEQLSKTKGAGLVTESSSSAGSKKPPVVKITDSNLNENVKEALKGL